MHFRIKTDMSVESMQVYVSVVANNGIDEKQHAFEELRSHVAGEEEGPYKEDFKNHVMNKVRSRICYPKRHPRMPLLSESLTLEFPDLGYRCCFEVWNGMGQWFYDPIPSSSFLQGNGLPIGTTVYVHSFFEKEMVTGDLEAFYMVERILQDEKLEMSFSMASRTNGTGPRLFYNLKIYLRPRSYRDKLGVWDTDYTECYISASGRLADVFSSLCGRNTSDSQQNARKDFALTQITHQGRKEGWGYSWGEATQTGILMRDLNWDLEDGVIWLLPSPCAIMGFGSRD